MARYKVVQEVLCVVRVWYEFDDATLEDVLKTVADNPTPTDRSISGTDYEIIEDKAIVKTVIEEVTT